jgi:hypothetical protein
LHGVNLKNIAPAEITCGRVLFLAFKQALHVARVTPDVLYPLQLKISKSFFLQLIESGELVLKDLTEEVSVLGLRVHCESCLGDVCLQSLELSFDLVDFIVQVVALDNSELHIFFLTPLHTVRILYEDE